MHDVPATGLVVGADDERLVVLVLVPVVERLLGRSLGVLAHDGVRDVVTRDDVGRDRGLGLVGGGLVAQGGSGSVLGHSHTDQGLNSQRTPFAKA